LIKQNQKAALFDNTGVLGLLFHAGEIFRTVMQFFSKTAGFFLLACLFIFSPSHLFATFIL
jgi:hypothetical protein